MSGDDDIIDAEVVGDHLPAVRSAVPAIAEEPVDVLHPEVLDLPPGTMLVPMDYATRLVVREALGHFHDNGPRQRSTYQIMEALKLMADCEQGICPLCRNQGYRNTMRGPVNCSCVAGNRRRGI